jgi:hypothetical protein
MTALTSGSSTEAPDGTAKAGCLTFEAEAASSLRPLPVIDREGIRWSGGTAGRRFELELHFRNPSDRVTQATSAFVRAADFGAHRPWTPLTAVTVPSVSPGGSEVVRVSAGVRGPSPRWNPRLVDDLARRLALRVTGPGVERSARANEELVRRLRDVILSRTMGGSSGSTMAGILPALHRRVAGRHGLHFVGNIDVFMRRSRPVERHLWPRFVLQRGRKNFAMFRVGQRPKETFRFDLAACPSDVDVELVGLPWSRLAPVPSQKVIVLFHARKTAGPGCIRIDVTLARTGAVAPVEFDLAPE